jgi:YfiH family protein
MIQNFETTNNEKMGVVIIRSRLFKKYPEINFAFSTKIGAARQAPYYFNLSHCVGDDEIIVEENRKLLFDTLGLGLENVAIQKQVHGSAISYVAEGGFCGDSDAMISDKPGLGLAISTADCTSIFLYDKKNKVIAAVHSGWRGTQQGILLKTLQRLRDNFNSLPENIIAYLGPSISQKNYEVGPEVADQFESKYLIPKENKFLLNVAGKNYDMLLNFGLNRENVQISNYCSYAMDEFLHSYRRDGNYSGRAYGIIALKT